MRYIGSKILLLDKISNFIPSEAHSVCDIFTGTASVSRHFKHSHKLISNDILYFSFVLQKAYLGLYEEPQFLEFKKKFNSHPIDYFNNKTEPYNLQHRPFIFENYSPNKNSQ